MDLPFPELIFFEFAVLEEASHPQLFSCLQIRIVCFNFSSHQSLCGTSFLYSPISVLVNDLCKKSSPWIPAWTRLNPTKTLTSLWNPLFEPNCPWLKSCYQPFSKHYSSSQLPHQFPKTSSEGHVNASCYPTQLTDFSRAWVLSTLKRKVSIWLSN